MRLVPNSRSNVFAGRISCLKMSSCRSGAKSIVSMTSIPPKTIFRSTYLLAIKLIAPFKTFLSPSGAPIIYNSFLKNALELFDRGLNINNEQ
jgi:hypothetical protein